ncbi:IS66 family transposase [Paracandidimonas lactea]|uniref:IS66 family transposase n=1 Tax=Paracandidimonas lactea TaxID=2895524 RepID=UPI001EFFBC71|nr:IS66 family transposase [Paracandidimonas lactea]
MNVAPQNLESMDAQQLRELALSLMHTVGKQEQELHSKTTRIQQLSHEIAVLKRLRFGKKGEHLPSGIQGSLLEEALDEDIAAIELELQALEPQVQAKAEKRQPKRTALPPELPRIEIRHDPASTDCACGCRLKFVRDEASEKLDYTPGVFSVQRHIRSIWACAQCETITQAPMPAHVIDKGLATPGLLAHVLVAKYSDHLPLHRQEGIFARAGLRLARSALAQWVGECGHALQPLVDALRAAILARPVIHADETPVRMLKAGKKETHRAYLWAYAPGVFEDLKAVVYDFAEGRGGEHARAFFGNWHGTLVCDDYGGYNALFRQGITEAGCMAHARRAVFDLFESSKSPVAGQAVTYFNQLYDIERGLKDLPPDERRHRRQQQAKPLAVKFHEWMLAQRVRVPDGSTTAKKLDYSLKRWDALTRYLEDGRVPIDNNHIERQIRPIAIGRSNWLFAGSLRAGKRAAAAMSLIQSAKLNGHDPYAYLKDVLTRLPTHPNNRIDELLPHNWAPHTS